MTESQVQKILEEILRQLAPEIKFSEIDSAKPLRDQVEIDSYDFYRLLTILEEKTGVRIPETKLRKLNSLSELIRSITDGGP
jgi:acyl carrier protein